MSDKALDKQVGGQHYKGCAIQPVEYIYGNNLDYLEGNVVKYITSKDPTCGESPPYSYLYPTPSL